MITEESYKEKNEEEEKKLLLELIKMQNETLKRIYKNTINKEKND